MKVLAIAGISVRRVIRDRVSLFFIVILPIMVILIVGASVRGFSTFTVGVVQGDSGAAGRQLTAMLESTPDLTVDEFASTSSLDVAVRRSAVSTGVVLPSGMERAIRGHGQVVVGILAETANTTQQAAAIAVDAVIARYSGQVQAARFAAGQTGRRFGALMASAGHLSTSVPAVRVIYRQSGASATTLPEGYSYSAPTMLVLFVFLTALTGSEVVIRNRRLGMYDRMMAEPVHSGSVIAGDGLGFMTIALTQSLLIVTIGALLFGVSWGNPLAASVLIGLWALVGAGAGMLSGTLFSTREQAVAIGPAVGIAFAMLGGCIWPLSIVGPIMQLVGHLTPQAWAIDAWTRLLSQRGTITSIAPQLLVLAAFAVGFLSLATWRLRRHLA
jgi:ABC-2 type transport system permease protein